jgi:pimeloyl-ACP methyl ester carboxylesterase
MTPALPVVVALFAAPAANLPTEVWQVAPDPQGQPWWQATTGRKDRAVLLVPGLKIHPLRPQLVHKPQLHDWQEPRSVIVQVLGRDADVFAFGYAQTVPVDVVAHSPGLRDAVTQMRRAGYKEVVLVGHSAGGLVARHFVEAYPDAGVTKVIQVAAPNAGSDAAAFFKGGYPKSQAAFVQSLAPAARAEGQRRSTALVSPRVELVCVVCRIAKANGDGLVKLDSQWPDDLQQQGVPAAVVQVSHFDAMKSGSSVRLIAGLARTHLTRWAPEQVDQARRVLFKDPDERRR